MLISNSDALRRLGNISGLPYITKHAIQTNTQCLERERTASGQAGRRPDTSWDNAGKFLRKISIFGATRCLILRLKCWGYTSDRTEGAYSTPPDHLAVFKGSTSKGKEGKGKREGGKR